MEKDGLCLSCFRVVEEDANYVKHNKGAYEGYFCNECFEALNGYEDFTVIEK